MIWNLFSTLKVNLFVPKALYLLDTNHHKILARKEKCVKKHTKKVKRSKVTKEMSRCYYWEIICSWVNNVRKSKQHNFPITHVIFFCSFISSTARKFSIITELLSFLALWLSFRWRKQRTENILKPDWNLVKVIFMIFIHTIPTNNAHEFSRRASLPLSLSLSHNNYSNFHPKSLCAIISAQALSSSSLASGNSMKIIIYPLSLTHSLTLTPSFYRSYDLNKRALKRAKKISATSAILFFEAMKIIFFLFVLPFSCMDKYI